MVKTAKQSYTWRTKTESAVLSGVKSWTQCWRKWLIRKFTAHSSISLTWRFLNPWIRYISTGTRGPGKELVQSLAMISCESMHLIGCAVVDYSPMVDTGAHVVKFVISLYQIFQWFYLLIKMPLMFTLTVTIFYTGIYKSREPVFPCKKLNSGQRSRFQGNMSTWLAAHITLTELIPREHLSLPITLCWRNGAYLNPVLRTRLALQNLWHTSEEKSWKQYDKNGEVII